MKNILSSSIKFLTGRDYSDVRFAEIIYVFKKGGEAYLRGLIWQIVHFKKIKGLMLGRGVTLLIPRTTYLGGGCSIGKNSYIELYSKYDSVIGNNVTIREFAWFQCRSGINKKALRLVIRNNVYIGPFCILGVGGEIRIGEGCQIGARFTVSAEAHTKGDSSYVQGETSRSGVHLGANVWVGNNVTVLDGVCIGDNSVIGAGSVVTKDIPKNSVAYGVPARVKRSI